MFFRTVRYENRASDSIEKAKEKWANVEDVVNAIEWAIIHDEYVGSLISECGHRGFIMPGARSINESDVDVIYQVDDFYIVIHDLTFREAKSRYAGNA